jgi:Domain of unknown function (DUF4386)
MTASGIDDSQRKAARVAGFAYLITFVLVVYVNFGIHDRLIADSVAETARNIIAHERLFRIGIVGDLLYSAGVVVQLTALYVIFDPVSRGLSLLAALWRLVWVVVWLTMTLSLFDALRLLTVADYARALEAERWQALAMLDLRTRFDYYYVGLLFLALSSTLCAYLWLKSGYIPRSLAALGVISSAFCVACTLVFYIFPNFDKILSLWWFDSPRGVFDIATSFWLLFRGLRPIPTGETGRASGRLPTAAL